MADSPFLSETLWTPETEAEEGVIQGDDRVRIEDTTGVPWRWICRVALLDSRGRFHSGGTGVLVSERHVLTAAHVVYPEYTDPYDYSIMVGEQPVSAKPKIPANYSDGEFDWDFALLTLKNRIQGGYWTAFSVPDVRSLNGKSVFTAGYPSSKGGHQLWCAAGLLHSADAARRTMRITADTTRGQSGSPVWIKDGDRYCLVGLAVGAGKNSNTVLRVTREMVDQVAAWIRAGGDTPTMHEMEAGFEPEVSFEEPAFQHDTPAGVKFSNGESLPFATGPEGPGEEYFDPAKSGNPLLDTGGKNRSKHLAKNFTVAELAHAGSTPFSKARIDPKLVDNLQWLHDFIRGPIEVLEGYYSYKFLADLAQKQKLPKVPDSPHVSGRGAKIRSSQLAPLELAKLVLFACAEDTRIGVGDASVTIYIGQKPAEPFAYISDGEKRERALKLLRQYRELYTDIPSDALNGLYEYKLETANRFVHWAVHEKQIRDERILAEMVFYRSWYVKKARENSGLSGRIDLSKARDKTLWDQVLEVAVRPILAEVQAPAEQHGGVPTTPKGERKLTGPRPDSPGFDISGRYEKYYASGDELGKTLHVNQAGKRVEAVFSQVLNPSVGRKRKAYRLYGDLEAGQSFKLFTKRDPDLIFHLKRNGTNLELEWKQDGKTLYETFKPISGTPFLTEEALHAFGDLEDLATAHEWTPLLTRQVQHLQQFCADAARIDKYLKAFYSASGDAFNEWKEHAQGTAAKKFDDDFGKWILDPRQGVNPNDVDLARFYIRYFFTVNQWRPTDNYPYLSDLDWIYRMVGILQYAHQHEPNRLGYDVYTAAGTLIKWAGVDPGAVVDGHVHTYTVTLELSGAAFFGGYYRGTITIEKTDDRKWPDGKVTFHMWLGAFGIGGSVGKGGKGGLSPVKLGSKLVGTGSSSIGWLPHDFPGRVDFATGGGSASVGVKGSAGGWFLHIHGRGGLPLLQITDEHSKLGAGGLSVGIELLGAMGKISDKDLPTSGYPSMTQETDYAKSYTLNKQTHFGFDSAQLTEEAREAVRAMCANELPALMNPDSRIKITAHTDSKDTAARNLELSTLRAVNTQQAIQDVLGNKLAAAIEAHGMGEAEANKAGEQDFRNMDRRRVDIELNGRVVLRLREK